MNLKNMIVLITVSSFGISLSAVAHADPYNRYCEVKFKDKSHAWPNYSHCKSGDVIDVYAIAGGSKIGTAWTTSATHGLPQNWVAKVCDLTKPIVQIAQIQTGIKYDQKGHDNLSWFTCIYRGQSRKDVN